MSDQTKAQRNLAKRVVSPQTLKLQEAQEERGILEEEEEESTVLIDGKPHMRHEGCLIRVA